MKHRRRSYVRIMMLYLIAILLLLFAWWASAEVYKPKPTPLPTDVIVLPPKATATDVHPVATNTAIPVTIATQTNTPVLVTATTQAPTYTATHRPPTATNVPPVIISKPVLPFGQDNDSISGRIRWRYYLKDNYYYGFYLWCGGCQAPPLPLRIPRGTIVPPTIVPHPTLIPPTIVPETPPPGVTPKP